MKENTLDNIATIATEIGGIAHNLHIIGTALDPHEHFEAHPEAFCMALFAVAQQMERIQTELDAAHLKLLKLSDESAD